MVCLQDVQILWSKAKLQRSYGLYCVSKHQVSIAIKPIFNGVGDLKTVFGVVEEEDVNPSTPVKRTKTLSKVIGITIASVLLCVAIACSSPREPGPSELLVKFDVAQGQLPEGLAVSSDALYVSMAPTSQLFRVTLDGKADLISQLPQYPAGQGFTTGVALDQQENIYVALASFAPEVQTGIYLVPPSGGEAKLFASSDEMILPNGLAFDEDGNLFVTDSFANAVFKIGSNGTVNRWVEDDLLKGDGNFCPPNELELDVGANGLAFDGAGNLFVLNTDKATIVRIPVNKQGTAGVPEIFVGPDCENLEGGDGIAIDKEGNLYVGANRINKLVKISEKGEITVLETGGLLDFPANVAFGSGDESSTLYIANFALISSQQGGGSGPNLVAKDVGIKGISLP